MALQLGEQIAGAFGATAADHVFEGIDPFAEFLVRHRAHRLAAAVGNGGGQHQPGNRRLSVAGKLIDFRVTHQFTLHMAT